MPAPHAAAAPLRSIAVAAPLKSHEDIQKKLLNYQQAKREREEEIAADVARGVYAGCGPRRSTLSPGYHRRDGLEVVVFPGRASLPLHQIKKKIPMDAMIVDLVAKPEFNNKYGTLVDWHDEKKRFKVLCGDDEVRLLRPENLELFESDSDESET